MNGSRTEYFTSPAIASNTATYLNKTFNNNFPNEEENKTYTELKNMDTNSGNECNDPNNVNVFSNYTGNDDRVSGGIIPNTVEEDNISHIGSDYSDFQPADQDNSPFIQPNIPNFYGEQYNEPDIKFNPLELMLRPPSGSAMHFNYNFPAVSSSQSKPPHIRSNFHRSSTANNKYTQLPNSSEIRGGPSTSVTPDPAATSHYPTNNSHSNPDCFHPNMWYPNASFGSYRSYGSSQNYSRHYGSKVPKNHMMDMFQISNSGREARNRAEKNRRDKLNGSIQELSMMVPHVAESPRRVDKTAVLRFAAHGLRLKYVFGKCHNNESTQTTDSLMKLLDSFFLTMTCNGQIVLVSSSIEEHLGHCQTDLYGRNILHITHPEDHQMLKEKLVPTDFDKLFDIQQEDKTSEPRQRTQAEEDEIDRRLREDKRSFTIRLARSGPRSDPPVYELVKIDGSFRRSDMSPRGLKASTFPTTLQLMRRSRGREEILPLHTISGNDIVLIAIARIVRPPVINRSIEVNRLEYKTRHLIDGRIIDCDQRISIVAGYMTDEVRNLSPFTFIHQDDVRWVIVALRQMYDCNSSYGESTYRLFTGNGKIIYLHTKGFLEIDKNTNKVHSFICLNTLLDEEEGKRRVESMKNKFSVIINTKIPQSSDDVPASENPQQLEKAVLCLIQNLKSVSDDDGDSDTFSSKPSYTNKSQNPTHNYQNYGITSPQMGCSHSLDLVPPETDSVKNSIIKSVNVVKNTAAKYLRSSTCTHQDTAVDDNCGGNDFHTNQTCKNVGNTNTDKCLISNLEQDLSRHYTSSGAVKRKLSYTETDNDEYIVPMHRQAIEDVLSNSLQQINNQLNQQLNTAMEIRDQGQLYEVPHTEECIADIMKEHQKQQEMYEDITNEFEIQRKTIEDSSIDNEILQNCPESALEETQQSHDQHQEYSQPLQQHNLLTMPTTTNATSVTSDAQLQTENHLQL